LIPEPFLYRGVERRGVAGCSARGSISPHAHPPGAEASPIETCPGQCQYVEDKMVETGQTAKVHYKGTLKDGSVFDSSEGKEPLAFEIGAGQVIAGFENAVRDMDVGETRTVTIESKEAYGPVRDDMIASIPKGEFPKHIEPQQGMMLQMRTEQGSLPIKIVDVTDDTVKVDGNHPLAGEDLSFELTLVEVN
jgi:peptidylprolyl isomerase